MTTEKNHLTEEEVINYLATLADSKLEIMIYRIQTELRVRKEYIESTKRPL